MKEELNTFLAQSKLGGRPAQADKIWTFEWRSGGTLKKETGLTAKQILLRTSNGAYDPQAPWVASTANYWINPEEQRIYEGTPRRNRSWIYGAVGYPATTKHSLVDSFQEAIETVDEWQKEIDSGEEQPY